MIQVREGFTFGPESGITSASMGSEGPSHYVDIHFEGGESATFPALSQDSATAATNQINQGIADGHGGSTEILIIEDF